MRDPHEKFIIGIDIGGTNTDAVIINKKQKIINYKKVMTTPSIEVGVEEVIKKVLTSAGIKSSQIEAIYIGTTQITNALYQMKNLYKVGILRLSGDCGESLPPGVAWPKDLREKIIMGHQAVSGGLQCDGRTLGELKEEEILRALQQLLHLGMESLVIIGVFSNLNQSQEQQVASIARQTLGDHFPITLSADLGGVGFINRENASILNASLKKSIQVGFQQLNNVLEHLNITCPLHLTQNNGTVLPLNQALLYPVLTISAGPTNSFIGSAKLAQLQNAIVVDVGGSTIDVGLVLNGIPQRSSEVSEVAGIPLNFPMPDVLSISVGGGSYVTIKDDFHQKIKIGPESCGQDLKQESISFGGKKLTLTDIAVAKGLIHLGQEQKGVVMMDLSLLERVLKQVSDQVKDLCRIVGGHHQDLPVIITGGGSAILKDLLSPHLDQAGKKKRFEPRRRYLIPQYAEVANAYGAACAEISATLDQVMELKNRDQHLQQLEKQVKQQAIDLGAQEQTVRIVYKEILPYNYIPQNLVRVKLVAAGARSLY